MTLARVGGQVLDLARQVRKPGPSNTGPRGALTTYSGPMTITTPGTVISGKAVTGVLTIAANDVTITNSTVTAVSGVGAHLIARSGTVTGLTIIDSLLDGAGTDGLDVGPYPSGQAPPAALSVGWGYTLRRVEVRGFADGIKPQDNPAGQPIVVDRCWVHGLVSYYTAPGTRTHNDTLQISGATGAHDVTVTGCTLDGYRPGDPNPDSRFASSSAIQFGSFSSGAVLRDITISGCWIDGGLYASRLGAAGADICERVRIDGNLLGLRHRFGVFTTSGTGTALDGGRPTATGNRWATTGTTDYGLAVTAGELVP